MAAADVKGISFTAGEPLIFLSEIIELIKICTINNIYSRVVTNGFWAKTSQLSDTIILQLKSAGAFSITNQLQQVASEKYRPSKYCKCGGKL